VFTTTEQQALLAKFDELATREGSQNKACAKVGVKAPIISALKKGDYPGNVEAQYSKLDSYFSAKEAQAQLPSTQMVNRDYVPTTISRDVYNTIRNCQLQGGLADICGDAGVGKTMACKRFIRDYPNDAIYIALNPCITTLRSVLRLLCNSLNISDKRSNHDMWFSIAAKLRDGMVIIVDEKQHAPVRTVDMLRSFSDFFSERGQTLGIAMVGNIEKFGSRHGNTSEMDQINNRTKNVRCYETKSVMPEDMILLFPDLADHKKEKELEFLLLVARSRQAIRGAVNLYNNAIDNGDPTYTGLVAMAKHMSLRV
jgi:DNA transposition AAA+ family ATPase